MSKSKVLTTPTRLSDLHFEDLYIDEPDLKALSLDAKKWHRFKREAKSVTA